MGNKHQTEYYYCISARANNRIVVIDANSIEDLVNKLNQDKLLNWDYIKLQKSVITHDTDKKAGRSIVSKKYSRMLVARAGSDESGIPKVDYNLTKNGVVPQNIKDFFSAKQKG